MRKIFIAVAALVTLAVAPLHAAPLVAKPEAALKKAFPQIRIDSMTASQIPGLYEVISGQNIFYYNPEKDLLLVGDMYTSAGQNLTGEKKRDLKEKQAAKTLEKLKDLPLDKAVKVGTGPKKVVEFTDPDCPYCRRASEALKGRTDITRYVFLTPLAHPNAITKVHYILSSKDQEQAYHEMMEGKPLPATATEFSKAVKDQAAQYMELARSLAVEGTPTFFINGQSVVGADMEKINELLK
ncbi:MAG: DsbC family protein [Geobacteraceae bacterium]|nr:DsbC family protein [Geobacteraceae bacterium]